MSIFVCSLWTLVVHCGLGWFTVDLGGSLWTLVVHCELWWFTVDFGASLWTLVVHCGLWWFPVDFGGSLWTLVVHFGLWWFIVDFCGSLWTLLVRSEFWWFTLDFGGSLWTLVARCELWLGLKGPNRCIRRLQPSTGAIKSAALRFLLNSQTEQNPHTLPDFSTKWHARWKSVDSPTERVWVFLFLRRRTPQVPWWDLIYGRSYLKWLSTASKHCIMVAEAI